MLMKAVGVERTVCPDFFRIDLEEGQTYRLLLCSDGLSGFCSDAEIQEVLQEDVSDTETAQKLIELHWKRADEIIFQLPLQLCHIIRRNEKHG